MPINWLPSPFLDFFRSWSIADFKCKICVMSWFISLSYDFRVSEGFLWFNAPTLFNSMQLPFSSSREGVLLTLLYLRSSIFLIHIMGYIADRRAILQYEDTYDHQSYRTYLHHVCFHSEVGLYCVELILQMLFHRNFSCRFFSDFNILTPDSMPRSMKTLLNCYSWSVTWDIVLKLVRF